MFAPEPSPKPSFFSPSSSYSSSLSSMPISRSHLASESESVIIILVLSSRVSKRVFARVLVAFNPRFPVGQPVATQICRLRVLRSSVPQRWFANFHPRSPFTRRAKLRLESVYDCSRVLIDWFYFFFFFFFPFLCPFLRLFSHRRF